MTTKEIAALEELLRGFANKIDAISIRVSADKEIFQSLCRVYDEVTRAQSVVRSTEAKDE